MIARNRTALFLILLVVSILHAPAQTSTTTTTLPFIPETAPQWVKDLRRWEIVAFGSIPFTMFTATFAMDTYRWSQTKDQRYAPWPFKSAGAIAMTNSEQELTFIMAAGLSLTVAFTDLIIVQVKRSKARKRAEAMPVGTAIIVRTPLPDESPPEAHDDAVQDDAAQGAVRGAQSVVHGATLGVALSEETAVPDPVPEMP